jgi:hypothetical protein
MVTLIDVCKFCSLQTGVIEDFGLVGHDSAMCPIPEDQILIDISIAKIHCKNTKDVIPYHTELFI